MSQSEWCPTLRADRWGHADLTPHTLPSQQTPDRQKIGRDFVVVGCPAAAAKTMARLNVDTKIFLWDLHDATISGVYSMVGIPGLNLLADMEAYPAQVKLSSNREWSAVSI